MLCQMRPAKSSCASVFVDLSMRQSSSTVSENYWKSSEGLRVSATCWHIRVAVRGLRGGARGSSQMGGWVGDRGIGWGHKGEWPVTRRSGQWRCGEWSRGQGGSQGVEREYLMGTRGNGRWNKNLYYCTWTLCHIMVKEFDKVMTKLYCTLWIRYSVHTQSIYSCQPALYCWDSCKTAAAADAKNWVSNRELQQVIILRWGNDYRFLISSKHRLCSLLMSHWVPWLAVNSQEQCYCFCHYCCTIYTRV